MPSSAVFVIDPDHAAFMQNSVSITAGSCSLHNVPSVTRAFGCRISPRGDRVSLLVSQLRSQALLRDVEQSGVISVVFSRISTHQTIQLKGAQAIVTPADVDDWACVMQHRQAFGKEIAMFGFAQGFIDNLLACSAAELMKIEFSPCAAFLQTPGPNAGSVLRAEP